MRFIKSIFLTNRFFLALIVLILLFVLGYAVPFIYRLSIIGAALLLGLVLVDIYLLYRTKGIEAHRSHDAKLSNGDENRIVLSLQSSYAHDIALEIIDEIPIQFQRRDILWKSELAPGDRKSLHYHLRPVKRGEYHFGSINVFALTNIALVKRKYQFQKDSVATVYPSIIQMKKYEIAAFTNNLSELGIKKIRRVGQTTEFDQIKSYVQGDDPRNINWKASAKSTGLMVNHYDDEKSQPVYCVIDKGRLMKSPFDGLTLMDYAINSALVMSNIAIKKMDKAGVITFAHKMSSVVKADRRSGQMQKILELLYNQKTHYKESNFELLANFAHRRITQRSLLLLYTNFDNLESFKRQLSYFRLLAKRHVLVVIFFKNTELNTLINSDSSNTREIYTQVIAEQLELEKQLIVKELIRNGIYAVLTEPADLNVNTINKYLELKARGLM